MKKKDLYNELEVGKATLWKWENGKMTMNAKSFVKLLQIVISNGNISVNQAIDLIIKAKI